MTWFVVSPAYGRDYRNRKDAARDFLDGKDFRIEGPISESGRYASISEFDPGDKVEIRYRRLTQLVVVTVPPHREKTNVDQRV